jgi:hypothetical protein
MDTVFAFLSALTAVISAAVAWYAVYRANEQARDQLRPIIVFDEMDVRVFPRPGCGSSEKEAGIIFRKLRNDGTGPATNMVLVIAFKRWKQPKNHIVCAGYCPHGRDYTRDELFVPLPGELITHLEAHEQADNAPDISFYYSDIFGRRFMTRHTSEPVVVGGSPNQTDPRMHFSQVEKDDHLRLPGEDANTRVITPEPKTRG